MSFILLQDLLDLYLSPMYISMVLLFFMALIWNQLPAGFQIFAHPHDEKIEGTSLLVKHVTNHDLPPVRVWFTTCMKCQFYHHDNDEEASSILI
ncbi:hypothetical protein [Bacillus sp. KH172YL63]|uniref:hypothetical protein n=1 Tax=Bacillus sp. KH172YL63 TaxID=2709784 RepID=UPI001565D5A0|nr:hypothetical protein [Bacillus sp. KH172YL63]